MEKDLSVQKKPSEPAIISFRSLPTNPFGLGRTQRTGRKAIIVVCDFPHTISKRNGLGERNV